MTELIQSRWKSPIAWASLLVKLLSILVLAGVINVTQAEIGNQIIGALLLFLTGYSDFNNPQNSEGF